MEQEQTKVQITLTVTRTTRDELDKRGYLGRWKNPLGPDGLSGWFEEQALKVLIGSTDPMKKALEARDTIQAMNHRTDQVRERFEKEVGVSLDVFLQEHDKHIQEEHGKMEAQKGNIWKSIVSAWKNGEANPRSWNGWITAPAVMKDLQTLGLTREEVERRLKDGDVPVSFLTA